MSIRYNEQQNRQTAANVRRARIPSDLTYETMSELGRDLFAISRDYAESGGELLSEQEISRGDAATRRIYKGSVNTMIRRVILYPGEDGYVVAEVLSLPGCISQGKTRDEALVNVREAIALHIEVLRERGEEKA